MEGRIWREGDGGRRRRERERWEMERDRERVREKGMFTSHYEQQEATATI